MKTLRCIENPIAFTLKAPCPGTPPAPRYPIPIVLTPVPRPRPGGPWCDISCPRAITSSSVVNETLREPDNVSMLPSHLTDTGPAQSSSLERAASECGGIIGPLPSRIPRPKSTTTEKPKAIRISSPLYVARFSAPEAAGVVSRF